MSHEYDLPERHPQVVVADFDRLLGSGYQLRMKILIEYLLLLGIALIFLQVIDIFDSLATEILTACIGLGLIFLLFQLFCRWRRRRAMESLGPGIQAIVRIARRLPRPWQQRFFGPSARCDELVEAARGHHPEALAFAGSRAFREIEDVPLTDRLFEPAPLSEGGRPSWSIRSVVVLIAVALFLIAMLLPLIFMGQRGLAALPCSIPFILLGSVFLKDLPWFTRWRREAARRSMRTIVGPGFLLTRGRGWTRDDSVLLLHDPRQTDWKVEATLVGPSGVHCLRFQNRRGACLNVRDPNHITSGHTGNKGRGKDDNDNQP